MAKEDNMNQVALIIIYNHQYNDNIEVLETIYKGRFSNIYHLVPFYSGEKSNVIPVFENSLYFQGYVAQGMKSYYRQEYTHYFFIGDDVILNPIINEDNYNKYLNLEKYTCFCPELISLHTRNDGWHRVYDAFKYNLDVPIVEVSSQLPTYNEALKAFQKFGLELKPLSLRQTWKQSSSIQGYIYKIISEDYLYRIRKTKIIRGKIRYVPEYPLVGSYADIFIVSSNAIKQFCHYCGVFAATRLHVELAISTSLVLSASEIVCEKDLEWRGLVLWGPKDRKNLEDRYRCNLHELFQNFPKESLYIHPVKLSKWKMYPNEL